MPPFVRKPHSWRRKAALAAGAVVGAVRSERNFRIHLSAALAVLAAAAVLGASRVEWFLLILCIAAVLAAEMFNTALEHLARAVTPDENNDVRDALDAASGAVLIAAAGAAVVGGVVLLYRLALALGPVS